MRLSCHRVGKTLKAQHLNDAQSRALIATDAFFIPIHDTCGIHVLYIMQSMLEHSLNWKCDVCAASFKQFYVGFLKMYVSVFVPWCSNATKSVLRGGLSVQKWRVRRFYSGIVKFLSMFLWRNYFFWILSVVISTECNFHS